LIGKLDRRIVVVIRAATGLLPKLRLAIALILQELKR
jgi:hypothetical protein